MLIKNIIIIFMYYNITNWFIDLSNPLFITITSHILLLMITLLIIYNININYLN